MGPLDGPGAGLLGAVFVRLARGNPEQCARGGFVSLTANACPAAAGSAENDQRGCRAFWPADEVVGGPGKDAGVSHEQTAKERVFLGGAADGGGEDDEVL